MDNRKGDVIMKYFRDDMTHFDAQKTLFEIAPGKSESELKKIKKEYREIVSILARRDCAESDNVLTSYPMK